MEFCAATRQTTRWLIRMVCRLCKWVLVHLAPKSLFGQSVRQLWHAQPAALQCLLNKRSDWTFSCLPNFAYHKLGCSSCLVLWMVTGQHFSGIKPWGLDYEVYSSQSLLKPIWISLVLWWWLFSLVVNFNILLNEYLQAFAEYSASIVKEDG